MLSDVTVPFQQDVGHQGDQLSAEVLLIAFVKLIYALGTETLLMCVLGCNLCWFLWFPFNPQPMEANVRNKVCTLLLHSKLPLPCLKGVIRIYPAFKDMYFPEHSLSA